MTETTRRAPTPTVPHRVAAAIATALAIAILIASAPAPSGASTASQSPEHAIDRGALLYRIHCANCHGDDGEGDGPMADLLTEQPTDLTRLPHTAEGGFPADEVRAAIDGREAIASHGRQEMPVWGLTFQQRGRDTDQEAEVRGRIDDLIAFLRSIQERPVDDGSGHGDDDQGPSANGNEPLVSRPRPRAIAS
jgi:mono/diheme cytochrome c family protein